jgi:signal transduction histidine kinase
VDLSAYRIVQEALTNIRKHADARHVHIHIAGHDDRMKITVVDDGRGPIPGSRPGRGLPGMRERAALFGGTFSAGSAPDGGYRIHAILPTGEA